MTGLTLNLQRIGGLPPRAVVAFYLLVLAGSVPIWPFGWHLTLHVLGATMLIGNAIAMAVWLTVAGFSGSDRAKRRAARVVNLGDVWFTVPGAAMLLLNGLAMVAARYGGIGAFSTTAWITAGLILLTATGLIWALRLLPAQLTLARLAAVEGPLDTDAFRRTLNGWSAWGIVATVLPLVAALLMTTKPSI